MTGNLARRSIGPKFSFTTSHCWAVVPKTEAGPPTEEVMPEREAWDLVMRNLRMARTTAIRASRRTTSRSDGLSWRQLRRSSERHFYLRRYDDANRRYEAEPWSGRSVHTTGGAL